MSSMIWARSWPLGASTSTWTPDLVIWCLSSMTSCRSRETWRDTSRTCKVCVCVNTLVTHILVVLLQVGKLLPHSFDLALDVHPVHVGVIDDLLQPCDVGLHRLADRRLVVKPVGVHRKTKHELLSLIQNVGLDHEFHASHPVKFKPLSKKQHPSKTKDK